MERLLHFVETSVFTKRIGKLANIETLFALQNALLENPRRGAVIANTDGARKARISNPLEKRGKSGSFRYIYTYFEEVEVIYLLVFYSKNEKDDLTDTEEKAIKKLIGEIRLNIKERYE